jgi:hypothetical protein
MSVSESSSVKTSVPNTSFSKPSRKLSDRAPARVAVPITSMKSYSVPCVVPPSWRSSSEPVSRVRSPAMSILPADAPGASVPALETAALTIPDPVTAPPASLLKEVAVKVPPPSSSAPRLVKAPVTSKSRLSSRCREPVVSLRVSESTESKTELAPLSVTSAWLVVITGSPKSSRFEAPTTFQLPPSSVPPEMLVTLQLAQPTVRVAPPMASTRP